MNLNKVVFRFVSISFSILVILLVLIGFVKIGTYCYDFGYRVFTEAPVDAEPGRDVIVQISDDMSDMDIAKELKEKGLVENAKLFLRQASFRCLHIEYVHDSERYDGAYGSRTGAEFYRRHGDGHRHYRRDN